MQEQKQSLEADIAQWESDYKRQHGKAAAPDDRTDSARESYTSLEEATHMLNKLTAQVTALESLKRGDIPAPPAIEKEVIEIKETEVQTVEVRSKIKL